MYGKTPKVIERNVTLDVEEVAYCLYMPVSLAGRDNIVLPAHVAWAKPILDIIQEHDPKAFMANIVYLTVKRMIVGPTVTPNRPGWHTDGFGTNDLNYIWYDCVPTIFNNSKFTISNDHLQSLVEFEQQADPRNNLIYPCHALLELDPFVVHRGAVRTQKPKR